MVKAYPQGNTENTVKFIEQITGKYSGAKIVIIWDGVPYHRSQELREYLEKVNQGKTEEEWRIKCIRLAPNAPEQNPIEDVWLQGKEMLRKYWHLCKNFQVVKWLFEWGINQDINNIPKLKMYGSFS